MPRTGQAQDPGGRRKPVHPNITANRVEGAAVFNQEGDRIGKVDDLLIEKVSGKVSCAIVTFGAVLGVGGGHFPIPWSMLKYDTDLNGYVVDERMLRNAPSYEKNDTGSDLPWRDEVFRYWAAAPYWL